MITRIRYKPGGTNMMLGTADLTELLGLHRSTLVRMIDDGSIVGAHRFGQSWAIPAESVPLSRGVVLWRKLDPDSDEIASVNTAELGVSLIATPDPAGPLVVDGVAYSIIDVEAVGEPRLRNVMLVER